MENKTTNLKKIVRTLDSAFLGILIYSFIGYGITDRDYKNIEKPENFKYYKGLSSKIYSLNNTKNIAIALKNSETYYVSKLDENTSKLISKLEKKIDSVEVKKNNLEKSQEFINFRKEQKDKGKANNLFFYPMILSLIYWSIRFPFKISSEEIYKKNEN